MDAKLPDGELELLTVLWRLETATAKEIGDALRPKRDLNHATICTLLRRLEDRKCVRRNKIPGSREYLYEAIAKPEPTRKALVKNLLQRAFDGSGVELVHSLFQSSAPDADEIKQLESLLADLKKANAQPTNSRKTRRKKGGSK